MNENTKKYLIKLILISGAMNCLLVFMVYPLINSYGGNISFWQALSYTSYLTLPLAALIIYFYNND